MCNQYFLIDFSLFNENSIRAQVVNKNFKSSYYSIKTATALIDL